MNEVIDFFGERARRRETTITEEIQAHKELQDYETDYYLERWNTFIGMYAATCPDLLSHHVLANEFYQLMAEKYHGKLSSMSTRETALGEELDQMMTEEWKILEEKMIAEEQALIEEGQLIVDPAHLQKVPMGELNIPLEQQAVLWKSRFERYLPGIALLEA